MKLARVGMTLGLHLHWELLRVAMDEMSTCLKGGFKFIKGERKWKGFYERVAQLQGVRIDDIYACVLANAFFCDVLWSFQKLANGELIAAQHVLHTRLSNTNLTLWRELRIRLGRTLPSFGIGRHLETIATESEREYLAVDSNLLPGSMIRSITKSAISCIWLMKQLCPSWRISSEMECLLSQARSKCFESARLQSDDVNWDDPLYNEPM